MSFLYNSICLFRSWSPINENEKKDKEKIQITENELENCCTLSWVCSCYGMYMWFHFDWENAICICDLSYISYMMDWKIEDIFNGKNVANCEKSQNDLWNIKSIYILLLETFNVKYSMLCSRCFFIYIKNTNFYAVLFIDFYLNVFFSLFFLKNIVFINRNIDNVS